MNFSTNGLVFQLSEDDRSRLKQICQPVGLSQGQRLCEPGAQDAGQVYFLTSGCVTQWVQHEEQSQLAVGLVGPEGAVGLSAALAQSTSRLRFEVQCAGEAWCADSVKLQQLLRSQPALLWVIARYLWQMAQDIACMTASVQFDDVQTRLATWLVLSSQRASSLHLNLTHDQVARILGVRRVSITLAAVNFKDMGLLNYKRGSIDILDLPGLKQQAQSTATRAP